MEKPLVSVLLASYSHARYVEAAVRSVMAQTGVPFELIVVDDGSPDESPEILKRLSQELHFEFISRPNKGLVPTMNELLEKAQGKYFCSFASDDIMPQGRLKTQSSYLNAHPDAAACFGQIVNMDSSGVLENAPDPRYWRCRPQVSFEDLILGRKELHGCSEMIRTDSFKKLGGYDGSIVTEDFAMQCALAFKYGDLPLLDDVVCYYRRDHGSNLHKNYDAVYRSALTVLNRYSSHPLYRNARNRWKANWFSALAYEDKLKALRKLPELASFSPAFLRRLPKLFIPRAFLRF